MARSKGDVHDIGKNIVGVVLQCTITMSSDLGVMVPAREDPAGRDRGTGGYCRALRPHHAFARRDVPCRRRDGAAGIRSAAADGRRDHQPRAHAVRSSELPARAGVYVNDASRAWASSPRCCRRGARALYRRYPRRIHPHCRRTPRARKRTKQRLSLADARANALKLNWSGSYAPPVPQPSRERTGLPISRSPSSSHSSTGRRSSQPGSSTANIPRSSTTRRSAKRRAASMPTRPTDAAADGRRALVPCQCRDRVLAGEQRGRRYSHFCRRGAQQADCRPAHAAPAARAPRRPAQMSRSPISSRRVQAGCATISAHSR